MFPKFPAYKNLTLAFVLLVSFQIAIAQTNTWDGSASNDWNTPANWSLNVVPTNLHNVVIPISAAITVSSSPGTIKSLTISNSSTVSLTSSGSSKTLVLRNPNALALNVQAGSTLSLLGGTGGTGSQTMGILYTGSNNQATIAGTFNLAGGTLGGHYLATNSVTTVAGTFSRTNGKIVSTETNLIFTGGSTYVQNLNADVLPTAAWNETSTVLINGVTNTFPLNTGQIFGNMVIEGVYTRNIVLNTDLFLNGSLTITNNSPTFRVRLNRSANEHSITVGGNFVLNNGTFELVGSTGASNLNIAGSLIINGGLFIAKNGAGTSTIFTNDFTINGGTFDQRRNFGTGGTSDVNVFGNFSQTAGLYRMNSTPNETSTLNVFNAFSFTGGTIDEIGTGTSSGSIIFGGFINEYTSGGAIPSTSLINFSVLENSTLQFATPTTVVTGGGTFTTAIGSTLGIRHPQGISSTGATGQVQVLGTRTYATGANYIYNGSTNQVTGSGLTQNTAAFLTIENPGNTVSLSAPTEASADLVIAAGNFNLNNFDFTLGGEYYNNDIFTPGTAKFILNGAGIQSLAGNNPSTFYILELAKTSGSVILGIDQNVSNTLNIDVILDLSTFNLMMGTDAQAIGTLTGTFDETKMIVSTGGGQLRKAATNASQATYGFPLGDIDGTPEFSPAGILFSGGTYNGWVGVSVVNQKHPNNGNNTDYLNRYWTVDQTGFSGFTATVGFNFVPADVVGTETEVRLGQWEGNEPWIRFDPSLDAPLNLLTSTVTEFSDFTGLSVSEALPIHFGSIRGWAVNSNAIAIEWKILGETGTSHYEVEKLVSANNFAKIGSQNASNSGLDETYTFTDIAPGNGDNFYRIKGIELTGEITYSPVVKVKLSGSSAREMKVYPNPIKNSNLAISLQNFKSGKYEVLISNNSGQIIHNSKINQVGPNTIVNIQLNPTLSKGIYRLKITNGEDTYLSSFMKD